MDHSRCGRREPSEFDNNFITNSTATGSCHDPRPQAEAHPPEADRGQPRQAPHPHRIRTTDNGNAGAAGPFERGRPHRMGPGRTWAACAAPAGNRRSCTAPPMPAGCRPNGRSPRWARATSRCSCPAEGSYHTLGDLILALLRRLRSPGDRIVFAGWPFGVMDMDAAVSIAAPPAWSPPRRRHTQPAQRRTSQWALVYTESGH